MVKVFDNYYYNRRPREFHVLCFLQQGVLDQYLGTNADEDETAGKFDLVFKNMAEKLTDVLKKNVYSGKKIVEKRGQGYWLVDDKMVVIC
jgi:hypothetical protein